MITKNDTKETGIDDDQGKQLLTLTHCDLIPYHRSRSRDRHRSSRHHRHEHRRDRDRDRDRDRRDVSF